jgi:hypothetical protein
MVKLDICLRDELTEFVKYLVQFTTINILSISLYYLLSNEYKQI